MRFDGGAEGPVKAELQRDNRRVWVARHVAALLHTLFGVAYPAAGYLPELLRGLGTSFRKAMSFLDRRDGEKRREWLLEKLPGIFRQRIQDGWRIFYQDEAGFQTEGTLAAAWGVRGQATQVANYGRHGRVTVLDCTPLPTSLTDTPIGMAMMI